MDASDKDGRYLFVRHLQGLTFTRRAWVQPSPEWDHDHCPGCSATICNCGDPKHLREGFVALVPEPLDEKPKAEANKPAGSGGLVIWQPAVGGFVERWLCPSCFERYKDLLDLRQS